MAKRKSKKQGSGKTAVALPLSKGRRPILLELMQKNPAKLESFFEQLRRGMTIQDACTVSQINYSTVKQWLHRINSGTATGERRELYADFAEKVRIATTGTKERNLKAIDDAAQGRIETRELVEIYVRDPETGELRLEEKKVKSGKMPQWQASAWILERMFPREFGRLSRIHLTGKVQAEMAGNVVARLIPIMTRNFERAGISPEHLATMINEIRQEFSGDGGDREAEGGEIMDAVFEEAEILEGEEIEAESFS